MVKTVTESIGVTFDVAKDAIKEVVKNMGDSIPESEKANRVYVMKYAGHLLSDDNPNFFKTDKNGNEVFRKGGQLDELLWDHQKVLIKARPTCDETTLAKLKEEGYRPDEPVAVVDETVFTVFRNPYGTADVGEGAIGALNRLETFEKADALLMGEWTSDPDGVPEKVLDYLSHRNKTVEDLDLSTMKEIRRDMRLTWHENSVRSLQLVSRDIHQFLSHANGATYTKVLAALNNAQALLRPSLV